jgi:hypothetical protein
MSEWEPQEGEVVNRDEHGNPDVIMVSSDSRDDPYAVRFTTLRVCVGLQLQGLRIWRREAVQAHQAGNSGKIDC